MTCFTRPHGQLALLALGASMLLAPAAADASIGTTTKGPLVDSNAAGRAQIYRSASTTTGKVDRLSVFLSSSNTAAKVELGLFGNDSSDAGRRLARCVIAAPKASAWNRCSFTAVAVRSGTSYWTSVLQPKGTKGTIKYANAAIGSAHTYGSDSSGLTALPASWASGPDWGQQQASVYADLSTDDATSTPPATTTPPPATTSPVTTPPPATTPPVVTPPPATSTTTTTTTTPPPATTTTPPPVTTTTTTTPPPPVTTTTTTTPPPSTIPTTTTYPSAANTGVAGCPALRPSGGLTVRTNGAVIQNLDISGGSLYVQADNVTIKCVRITDSDIYPLRLDDGAGTIVQNVEVNCQNSQNVNSAIMGSDYTATAVNVHNCEDAFHAGQNTTIQNSYVHDLIGPPECPSCHSDAIQMTGYGGSSYNTAHVKILNNTLWPKATHANSAIIVKTDFGPISDVLIQGNNMNYGTYTVYSRDGGYGNPTNIRAVSNVFGRGYEFGLDSVDGTMGWTGNTWADTGRPIS